MLFFVLVREMLYFCARKPRTTMIVDIAHLNKHYGSQHVLRDVSLRIETGEAVGLLGPNGAGKSTLMKILIGIVQADRSRNGEPDCRIIRPDRIGYLSEQNPLYTEMYVREFLLFMARWTHSEQEVESLIERVGLSPEANKPIRALSKGYRQRVGLAQALMGKPKLLILDEPTTGLDPNQLEDIRRIVREQRQRCPVILSTHILQEVSEMCNRVVILDHGLIRADQHIDQIADIDQFFYDATHAGQL